MKNAPRRRGVTLVELLVVTAIMALLAAIAAVAVFRVVGGTKKDATSATLNKLQSKLSQRWSDVVASAARDGREKRIPTALTTYAGGDQDRTLSIWTYMRLKNEFPTTVNEGLSPVTFGGASLPRREGFFKLIRQANPAWQDTDTFTGDNTNPTESAVMFHAVLSQGGGLDGLEGQIGSAEITVTRTPSSGSPSTEKIKLPVFVDAWGRPIAFYRMAFATELASPPYSAASGQRDPLDPRGRLNVASGSWTTGSGGRLEEFWNVIRANHPTAEGPPGSYAVQNWVPTVISAGAKEELNFGANPFSGADDDALANLVGYRLRAGRKGDQ